MLQFFRLNDPYRLLFVLLVVAVLGIKNELESPQITIPEFNGVLVGEMMDDGKSMYSEVWHAMPPLSAFVQYGHDFLFGRSILARHITALIFIFFQAAFFGIMLISNRAFNESNYLPSFIMVLMSFFSFDTVSITGEIIGTTLLLLAMNNLLIEIEFKQQRDETIHNLGFYLGLASLSIFSYITFFFGVTLLLFVFTRIQLRRFGLFVIGFALPHGFINLWYYYYGNIDLLWRNFYLANVDLSSTSLISIKSLLILSGIVIVYFIFSLVMMRRDAHLTKYQSQIAQVMFLWLLFGLIEIYFHTQRSPQALFVCLPPLVYYISHYFLLIKRKWIAESMVWLFFIGTITLNSISSRKIIKAVDYSHLEMKVPTDFPIHNKKILVMEDNLDPYQFNATASFFLDWKIFKSVFEEPDVYQHVVYVATAFEKDPPEIIIDPNGHFNGILKYIPDIRMRYRHEGTYYVRIP